MLSRVVATEKKLRKLGVLPGMRVAFHVPNSAAMVVTVVACWRIGAVVVPVSTRYTDTQVGGAIEGMACDSLMITPEMLERLCAFRSHVFESVRASELDLDLSLDATIVLTSGSTGQPKGVLHRLANHAASARGSDEIIPFGPDDVWLVSLPMYHVSGLALIMRALLHGGTLLFPEIDWLAALTQERVSHISLVPTQLKQCLSQAHTASALSRLKAVLVGGASCPAGLVGQAQSLGIKVHVTYGASEAASQITTTRGVPVGSGHALSHAEVRIDEHHEILVKSAALCRGVVCQGQVTPVTDEQGWFHTGDLGRLDDQGHLFVLGRRDTQFISGGENICPEEIEQAILTLLEVEQCVVVPVSDATYGQRPAAFVKGAPSRAAMTDALGCLEKFKHPDHFLDWPNHLVGPLKPNRPLMQDLAKSVLAL
ncbi:MAG: o-succinylbenzoate--CoA ligase [Planctomycetes bacterium]|nr:o-succinylbenzoate--CoA ligase [Planctomycetota bacterium]